MRLWIFPAPIFIATSLYRLQHYITSVTILTLLLPVALLLILDGFYKVGQHYTYKYYFVSNFFCFFYINKIFSDFVLCFQFRQGANRNE